MKQIEYYLKLPYKMEVVEDVEEGGYVASFPDCRDVLHVQRRSQKR